MKLDTVNHEAISQIVFDERYTVSADQNACQLFAQLPHAIEYAGELVDAMATAYLIAVLESICIREMLYYVDPESETVVGAAIECRHCAPIPSGAQLRVTGWVERIGNHEATFRVQAQDEQEQVCEASIRLVIVARELIAGRIARKRQAIARREMFLAA